MKIKECPFCDGPGGKKTYANQVEIPINGRIVCIDFCINEIISALNKQGVETVASCCGHGRTRGRIDLADGRILWITHKSGTGAIAEKFVKNIELKAENTDLRGAIKIYRGRIKDLNEDNNVLRSALTTIRNAALPDPNDERDISLRWLVNKIMDLTKSIKKPVDLNG